MLSTRTIIDFHRGLDLISKLAPGSTECFKVESMPLWDGSKSCMVELMGVFMGKTIQFVKLVNSFWSNMKICTSFLVEKKK